MPIISLTAVVDVVILRVTEVVTESFLPAATSTTTATGCAVVHQVNKLTGIHQIQGTGQRRNAQTSIERYLYLTFLGTLGSYDDNTVTTLCTIDSGQRGILQDVNRCNIRGRNIVDIRNLETIDDVQWVVRLGY